MSAARKIAVVTGSRAEFGLLRPVIKAITQRRDLELHVIAAGSHLIGSSATISEIEAEFKVAARVPMQEHDRVGRSDDARAVGRGIIGFTEQFERIRPDVVVVLGDRIEAFAAATAAAISGIRVAHIHGGDRAEGVADESMRHAITKMAHIHLPATQNSALRLLAMGEEPARVHVVGSPAIDGLDNIPPLSDSDFAALGSPDIVVMLHPVGDDDAPEHDRAAKLFAMVKSQGSALIMHPNHDPGRVGIMKAIEESGCRCMNHLQREQFIGLLRRTRALVGNSSAGLIECSAIPTRVINIGRRQAGREMPGHVVNIPDWDYQTIMDALARALASSPLNAAECPHPYGKGRAGEAVAGWLAEFDPAVHAIRKRNSY